MEEMEDVVRDIQQGCAGRGVRVPAVLAAFLAKTLLENDPNLFPPETELSAEGVETLIRMTIARLCEKDEPALETIKMQVTFDSVYVKFEEDLEAAKAEREETTKEHIRAILAVKPRGSTDFETLTSLRAPARKSCPKVVVDAPRRASRKRWLLPDARRGGAPRRASRKPVKAPRRASRKPVKAPRRA